MTAHVDHGKSTLADRMLQVTELVDPRKMRDQYLDKMDIERERGITIKAQTARMPYKRVDGASTCSTSSTRPGTSTSPTRCRRALNACEGAILLVDAAQGMEAQTIANLYLALEADLEIIPVLNKIDLPAARPDEVAREMTSIIGGDPPTSCGSGQDRRGVEVLDAIVDRVPPPTGDPDAPTGR
jgi:GTP-binding protein LepA